MNFQMDKQDHFNHRKFSIYYYIRYETLVRVPVD